MTITIAHPADGYVTVPRATAELRADRLEGLARKVNEGDDWWASEDGRPVLEAALALWAHGPIAGLFGAFDDYREQLRLFDDVSEDDDLARQLTDGKGDAQEGVELAESAVRDALNTLLYGAKVRDWPRRKAA